MDLDIHHPNNLWYRGVILRRIQIRRFGVLAHRSVVPEYFVLCITVKQDSTRTDAAPPNDAVGTSWCLGTNLGVIRTTALDGHPLVAKSARTTMTQSKRLGKPSTKNGNCATTLITMATGHRSEHAGDS